MKFFKKGSSEPQLTEEIIDRGLDGLSPENSEDAYLRYNGAAPPANLLENLDSALLTPLNEDYLGKLDEVLNAFSKRTKQIGPISWKELRPGLETASPSVLRFIRYGENNLVLLRIDPQLFEIIPLSYREVENRQPMNVETWAKQNAHAAAFFNAGQYYPDFQYMGMLQKDGLELGSGLHPQWQGLLLSGGPGMAEGVKRITILDLAARDFDPKNTPYRFAAQSFMLLDAYGSPRVRITDRLASRMVVAQEKSGRILVIFVPGACTLYELALLLKNPELGIEKAMCLDGGFESQLFIRDHSIKKAYYGSWVINDRRQYHGFGLNIPLPTVFAVVPRPASAQPDEGR